MIGPIFRDTFHLGTNLQLREIVELDEALGANLGENSANLIAASQPFIEGKGEMRGHREWRKYILKMEADEAPGHLPVIFALHSVLFRLPLVCAMQSYAWLEWKLGHYLVEQSSLAGYPEEPPPLFLEVKPEIARILTQKPIEDEGNPGLRVV